MTERTRTRLVLLAILVVAAIPRLHGVADRSTWIDEDFCIRLAQFGWGDLAAHAALDNHPPLYFVVLKAWMSLFGDSSLALRVLSIAIGLATIGVVFTLAKRIFATRAVSSPLLAAAIAAGWVAVHPTHVLWSAQIRMYALAGLLAVTSALLLLRALDRPASWRRWGAWALVAIALLYTHYYGAFVVLGQGLHAGIVALRSGERRVVLARVVASGIAIVVGFAPWLSVVRDQAEQVVGGWWVPPLTASRLFWGWSRIPGLHVENEFVIPSGLAAIALGVLAIAVGLVVVRAALDRDRGMRLAAWCTLFPLAGGVAMSLATGKNVVLSRYLIVAEVFAPIVIVGMVFAWTSKRVAPLLFVPLAVAVISSLAIEVAVLTPKPDAPAAADWIAQRREPHDLLVVHQFYYWWYRLHAERDPRLRMYTYDGKPIHTLGAALVDADDHVLGPARLRRMHGHVFVVSSQLEPVQVPRGFEPIAHARFEVAMPPDRGEWIDVTLYDAP